MQPSEKLDTLVQTAYLYYHEGLTQAEIAQALKISRPTVANLLQRARTEGLVTITLRPDFLSSLTLARELKSHFSLTDVLIAPTVPGADSAAVNRSLGSLGALYLEKVLTPGDVIATAWGATMLEVAQSLSGRKVENVTVAQSLGGLSTADSFNPGRVATLMGDKLGARAYHLYVPAVVESREVRDILLRDRSIYSAFEVARSAHRAILGIGKVAHDATVVRAGFLSPVQMDELRLKGAVGDMWGRIFDVQGKPVVTELDGRIIALSLQDLKTMSPVIAVAGGEDKVEAILGALRGGYLDVLIVDEGTAKQVLRRSYEDAEKSPAVSR